MNKDTVSVEVARFFLEDGRPCCENEDGSCQFLSIVQMRENAYAICRFDGIDHVNGLFPLASLNCPLQHLECSKAAKTRFLPPSPEQASEYAKSIGFDLDGSAFVDYYSTRGWKVGKKPMVDWMAAVRTWKRRSESKTQGGKPVQTARLVI